MPPGGGDPGDPSSWRDSLSRLHTLVVPSRIDPPVEGIDPPVETRVQVLPFESLAWENFERLCLRLAMERGEVDHSVDHAGDDPADGRRSARDARLYGTRGQDQQGIDLYVRLPPAPEPVSAERRYLCLQSRRIAKLTPAMLRKAVTDFLAGSWAPASRVFVYATSLAAVRRELGDEIRKQTDRLEREGIGFEVWDAELMSPRLKERVALVYDFFGRAWAESFCGREVVARLGTRLDAEKVGALRDGMRDFYTAMFDVTDSGMIGLRRSGAPRLGVRDRFVLPDVMVTSPPALGTHAKPGADVCSPVRDPGDASWREAPAADAWYQQAQSARYGRSGLSAPDLAWPSHRPGSQEEDSGGSRLPFPGAGTPIRTDPDTWLASGDRHVLVGAPGSGKTTFLRYLVLDMLSDAPALASWARRLGDRLPVWLPFHFFTWRRAKYCNADASLAATLRAWLEQYDAGDLWPLVEVALEDERLLLIVDGLDEWATESAGHSAKVGLETFLGVRKVPALVSARPYGLTRMPLAGEWEYASVAVLSPAQQRQLAGLWFSTARDAGQPGPGQSAAEGLALDDFMAHVERKAELRQLAGTPLFLLLLVGLRLSGVPLPDRRFDVYDSVVSQLLTEHAGVRAAAAGVTPEDGGLSPDDVRQVLAHMAFQWQARGQFTPVPDSTIRADAIAALKDPGHLAMDAQTAARMARTFTEIAEGQLGVLVRYGHQELGFLHRVFLEELAAEHAADQLPAAGRQDLFARRACDPRWNQVLLAILWRNRRPAENSELVQVIADQANDDQPEALTARELLAEAVFAGFRLPAADTARHSRVVLDTVQTHPHLPHRQRLLAVCVAGLSSAAGSLLRERLPRWTLAPQPLPPSLFRHLGQAASDASLHEPVWPVLVAALALEDLAAVCSAAFALADRYGSAGHAEVRDALLNALRNAATADHAALVLLSLTLGWPADRAVQELTAWARRQETLPVCVVALGAVLGVLRRALIAPDAAEEPLPGAPAVSEGEREWLVRQLHARDNNTGNLWRPLVAHTLAAAVRDQPAAWEKARDDSLTILDKEHHATGDRALAWALLLLGRPEDPAVLGYICDIVRTDPHYVYFLGHLLLPLAYPGHPVVAQAVEGSLRTDRRGFMESQLHALAVIDHGPVIREELLRSLTSGPFPHWAADALATHWAGDEQVQAALRAVLDGEPDRASYASVAAVRVLGHQAAIERLLALLSAPRDGQARIRRDIITRALIDACHDRTGRPGPDAERIAAACLEQLNDPADEHDAAAEAEVIAAMASTQAARTRAEAMLARPQPPLAALAAGYAREPATLQPVLQRLHDAFPSLPAQLRAHLCTLLRDTTAGRPLVRDLTRRWADDPDDLVATVASAAFHSHLRRDQTDGTLQPGEWDTALAAIRREAVKGSYLRWGHQRGAWLGALLLDQPGILDDLREPYGQRAPARLHIGDVIRPVDMILLSEIADRWPALRAHFGDRLLSRLTGDSSAAQDTGNAWNYLALVAERQQLLSQELAQAVADQPALLAHDGVLAWYAGKHHGDDGLTGILINHLDDGGNARTLASMLLAEPHALGLDPEAVQARLHALFSPQRLWYPPYQSGALEALSDGFPGDEIVQKCWDMVTEQRQRGEPANMHPRTYFPLAYAAVPATGILDLHALDVRQMAAWGDAYFDPQFSRAVIRRLRRDASARTQLETSILDAQTTDTSAGRLASLLAASFPLSHELTGNLAARRLRQRLLPAPDMTHDYVSGTDIPVPLLLLQILHSGTGIRP